MPDTDLGQDPVSYGDAAHPVRQDPWEYIIGVHWGGDTPPPPPPEGMVLCGTFTPQYVHTDDGMVDQPSGIWFFSGIDISSSAGLPLATLIIFRLTGTLGIGSWMGSPATGGVGIGPASAGAPEIEFTKTVTDPSMSFSFPFDLSLPVTPSRPGSIYNWWFKTEIHSRLSGVFITGYWWADIYCPA